MSAKDKKNSVPKTADITDLATSFGKLPPQNLEAEEAVLGAILIEKEAMLKVVGILNSRSFYKPANRTIYEAALQLHIDKLPIDLLGITQQLRKFNKLDEIGGTFYLVELTQCVSSAANLEFHSRIVVENALKRELITATSKGTKDAFDYATDVFDCLDELETAIMDIKRPLLKRQATTVSEILYRQLAHYEALANRKEGELTGVPSGLHDLDKITSGWQRSDLIIIAARPGMGKTSFVVSAIRNAVVDYGKKAAIFSLEMSKEQLVDRLVSSESEVPLQDLRNRPNPYQIKLIHERIGGLATNSLVIDDQPAISILELRSKARMYKNEYGIELIMVDYLQLMRGNEHQSKNTNREQEISTISRELKALAKELDVPVIALSQLSRAVETRGGDKRPMLSDLRESGSIEQDADMVIFLYRPEYYGIEIDANNNPTKGVAELIIAKHRNGSLDTALVHFIGAQTKFANFEKYDKFPTSKVQAQEPPPDNSWGKFPAQSTSAVRDFLEGF